jgi:hypothetical protein
MLQAHSFLWHYLWIAPHVLQLALAGFLWRRGLHRTFPVFFTYIIFEAVKELTLYAIDMIPSASAESFWRVFFGGLIVEGLLKFAVIGEVFARVFRPYTTLGDFSGRLIRWSGAVLVLSATVIATRAPMDNTYRLVPASHILEQTIYIVTCGLLVLLFLVAAYFNLTLKNIASGIALGLGISACFHLGTWAISANGGLLEKRVLLDFLNMAAYHACVLIWIYYFVVPPKAEATVPVLPAHNLDLWNRELERLLQQ